MYNSSESFEDLGREKEKKAETQTERPVILIPDLNNLSHVYNKKQPVLVILSNENKYYLDEWRRKQRILFEFVNSYTPRDKDIEDPCPYEDDWYIFGLRPFINKSIYDVLRLNKNIID